MTTPNWHLSGQYCETCSCDFVCPCIPHVLAVEPTKGTCTFAMAFRADKGRFGDVPLDGLAFVIIGRTPEAMGKGNWSVGILADERATPAQQEALIGICSGQAGGPMAALAPLVGTFLGLEKAAIKIDGAGLSWSVSAPNVIDMAMDGVVGLAGGPEPIHLDNTGHPAASRIAIAKARHSHLHALGLDWDDVSGRNNGQFAPFQWRSA